MQRSEILEPKEREDSISRSLMMMWSVALTGLKPCQMLSEKAMQALADLHSARKNIERTVTASSFERDVLEYIRLGLYHPGDNGASLQPTNDADTKARLNILKRVICLLRQKIFGA